VSVESFVVDVPQSTLDDLQQRLANTRTGAETALDKQTGLQHAEQQPTDWDAGTSPAYLRELVDYWQTKFDWRAQEVRINGFAHFRTLIDGAVIHFIHERGRGNDPLPIVLTHGYPDSFLRFTKLIPLLTDPAAHGADARDAFDVIVPSLPGFAFSDKPTKSGTIFKVGDLWHKLMVDELGYSAFGAHGGDWGATVTEYLARSHSRSVIGIHLTDVPFWHSFQKPADLTPAEQRYFDELQKFQKEELGYAMIQGTRPQTLADSLNDSPAGLAAWLVEKFQRMSDCNGDIESRFSKDELLANVTLYWVTQTIGSAFLPYYDLTNAGPATWIREKAKEWLGSTKVPTAIARFPKEMSHPPREWAERFYNVQRWTEFPSGGHFAAMEEPELLAQDLREFFRPLRNAR
jgi:pimeloyl-ACP methyl ester carboxylesterase